MCICSDQSHQYVMNAQLPRQAVPNKKKCVPVEKLLTFSFPKFAPHAETLCRAVSTGGNIHIICILERNIECTCSYLIGIPGPSDMRGLGEGVCNSRSGKFRRLKGLNPSTLFQPMAHGFVASHLLLESTNKDNKFVISILAVHGPL